MPNPAVDYDTCWLPDGCAVPITGPVEPVPEEEEADEPDWEGDEKDWRHGWVAVLKTLVVGGPEAACYVARQLYLCSTVTGWFAAYSSDTGPVAWVTVIPVGPRSHTTVPWPAPLPDYYRRPQFSITDRTPFGLPLLPLNVTALDRITAPL